MIFGVRRRTATLVALAASGSLLLTACQVASAGADNDPAHSAKLQKFYNQKPRWKNCGDGLQCASLKVPMDYKKPKGRTFTLPLVKHPAENRKKRIGAIVYNPGGPGASGVEDLKGGTITTFGKKVRARFDVVSFDPRGVGGSKPAIKCPWKEGGSGGGEASAPTLYPDDAQERRTALAGADAEAKNCRKGTGEVLRHVGTPDAARDVDVLRSVLGDKKINFLGWSYGTSLGTTYGELFPHRVRTMVLDGAVDPSLNWQQRALSQGTAFAKSIDDYAQFCPDLAGDRCPGTTPEEIRDVVDTLYRDVEAEPLPVQGSETTVDIQTLHGVITDAMYSPEDQWEGLSDALWEAYDQGDGTKLQKLSDGEEPETETARTAARTMERTAARAAAKAEDNSGDALLAINCLDIPHPKDPGAYWKALGGAHRKAGVFGTQSIVDEMSCRNWPKGTTKPHRAKTPGMAPALVIGTTGDPATPYHEARSLAKQLPKGMLLTYEGLGHTAYGRGGSCVSKIVDDYFLHRKKIRAGATC
ncbi:alpha/beta fold hydrolase [Streptomyces sp. NA04227]|uniref:alpha/beta hydrolase n=1 Tax=Streptomyces sp. NA04227 TaxID=2742136 RepID=UPI0015903DF8|nr:alpha/beta hydrolase [Streptomyces sp. NA04227]QKW06555.1 alpha/beta fold hydrolase [Streptomyces sp. NA04227]